MMKRMIFASLLLLAACNSGAPIENKGTPVNATVAIGSPVKPIANEAQPAFRALRGGFCLGRRWLAALEFVEDAAEQWALHVSRCPAPVGQCRWHSCY